jgi:flavin reductase (DIM6/NTAB) family NADH-FMN oxidoreductase RutF
MVTPDLYRQAMGSWGTGVTIVTTAGEDGIPYGLTVSSFTSVSLEPPLILVCLDNRLSGIGLFQTAKHFGVSILADSQEDVSRVFAKKGSERPASLFTVGRAGVPLIRGALVGLECEVAATYPGGDHTIFLGRPLSIDVMAAEKGEKPLLYFRGRYERLP